MTHCWRWNGAKTKQGYGKHWHEGKTVPAHRWMYEQVNGPVSNGLDLDHVRERGCRYRDCINPDHLEPVTPAVNTQRGMNAKLTDTDVRQIRAMAGTMTQEVIAARFGINASLVSMIVNRKRWRNVA
jgi:hypothetical protein